MRVAFEHSEKKTGLLFKKTRYFLTCMVELTDEERKVLKQRDYESVIVLSTGEGMYQKHLAIGELLKKPHIHEITTSDEDQTYEARLTQGLRSIKELLERPEVDPNEVTILEL